jgi:hypothetical protein
MQFGEGFFDDLAEVTSFAGVDDDLTGLGHSGEFSKGGRGYASGIEEFDGLRARSFADFRPLQDDGGVTG